MTKRSYTSTRRTADQPTKRPEFELDDVTWVCEGDISVLDLSEYARLANQGVDSDSPEGVAILADVYSGLLGSSYQRFRAHCRKHGTDGDVLVQILGDLIAETSDRPTSRPSDSSDGPKSDPATAMVVSFKRGTVEHQEPQETPPVVSYG